MNTREELEVLEARLERLTQVCFQVAFGAGFAIGLVLGLALWVIFGNP